MKRIVSWSTLVSFFTIFFYWFGHWYYQGYTSYFGVSHDLSVKNTIIKGFISSIGVSIWLVPLFILISFFLQFSKDNWKIFGYHFLIILVYTLYILVNLFKKVYSYFSNIKRGAIKLFFTSSEKKYCTPLKKSYNAVKYSIILLCQKISNTFNMLKTFFKSSDVDKIIKELKTEIKIIEENFDSQNKVHFDIQYALHYLLLIILTLAVVQIFGYTENLNKQGYEYAKEIYTCSSSYKKNECPYVFDQIKIDGEDKSTKWYLTDICTEQKCIVVNDEGASRWIDLIDKDVIFDVEKSVKSASKIY